jgi:hypothetical protein
MTYVENNWEESWLREGEDRLQAAWSRYKDLPVESPGGQPVVRSAATAGRRVPLNPFLRDIEMGARQQQLQTPPDELERYRQMPFMCTAESETRYSSNAIFLVGSDRPHHVSSTRNDGEGLLFDPA